MMSIELNRNFGNFFGSRFFSVVAIPTSVSVVKKTSVFGVGNRSSSSLDIRKFSFAHRTYTCYDHVWNSLDETHMRVLSHMTQLTVLKIELINLCTVEGS